MKLSYFIPCSGLLPVRRDAGDDVIRYQKTSFCSASVQHKVVLPPGLWLRPQSFRVMLNPCKGGGKWSIWLCSQETLTPHFWYK